MLTQMRVYHVGTRAMQSAMVVKEVLNTLHISARVSFRHGDVLVSTDAPKALVIKVLLNQYTAR